MSSAAEALSDYPTTEALVPFCEAPALQDPHKNAALMIDALAELQTADLADCDGSRRREYERLEPTYAAGICLQNDEVLRNAFYCHASWRNHLGRPPKPEVDGADSAMHFAVAKVIGGHSRERNQRASMIANALWYLSVDSVAPENLVNEIEKGRGPDNRTGFKNLAALAAKLRRSLEPSTQGSDESLDAENTTPVKLQLIKVLAPALVVGRLPAALYLVVDGEQVALSAHPNTLVPVDLDDGPT